MDNSALQIEFETCGTSTVVTIIGDIDLSKSQELRSAIRPILDSKPNKIVIDLEQVSYMDSSAIATLIEGLQLCKQSNIEFVLCSLTEGVRSIIELARLDKIFTIYESREQTLGE